MFQAKKVGILLVCIAIMGSTLIACGNKNNSSNNAPSSETQATATPAPEQTEETTRMFTDWTGHEVEIPVNPKRVIYHGEVTGDVLALGVVPVGVMKNENGGTVYDDLIANVEDVGFPLSLEKSLELNPDLIIFSNSDATQYEQISKIAPTVTFDSFAPITERMHTLGDLLGKQAEAEAWLTKYNTTMQEMWTLVHENGVKEGETASVFTMYPGNRLFIMAGAGLPQFLYEENGFKPVNKVQEIIDQEIGFVEISAELLNEYAGDRIFILNPVDPTAQQSTSELMESEVWKNLSAVKNGYVYNFDIVKAGSDALSRDWMIEELPKLLMK
ncbi:MAG: ABC transporter substrate-binding protein [Candidatus Pristimantibacillus lignocellulolyticus]|uniref:ABC transporter substrate-binding protein n=1 Tax=Candidatus Pristimantibacillus lignocellulolyticus TaxID=2994561 RepID=A0A9J6ZIE0_9BACL|nr:MAG: ABC transporter substrate-binding protein [Candidatus Pristimantibacillus lignocellulolyticus]